MLMPTAFPPPRSDHLARGLSQLDIDALPRSTFANALATQTQKKTEIIPACNEKMGKIRETDSQQVTNTSCRPTQKAWQRASERMMISSFEYESRMRGNMWIAAKPCTLSYDMLAVVIVVGSCSHCMLAGATLSRGCTRKPQVWDRAGAGRILWHR
jgi:hypothetical protein